MNSFISGENINVNGKMLIADNITQSTGITNENTLYKTHIKSDLIVDGLLTTSDILIENNLNLSGNLTVGSLNTTSLLVDGNNYDLNKLSYLDITKPVSIAVEDFVNAYVAGNPQLITTLTDINNEINNNTTVANSIISQITTLETTKAGLSDINTFTNQNNFTSNISVNNNVLNSNSLTLGNNTAFNIVNTNDIIITSPNVNLNNSLNVDEMYITFNKPVKSKQKITLIDQNNNTLDMDYTSDILTISNTLNKIQMDNNNTIFNNPIKINSDEVAIKPYVDNSIITNNNNYYTKSDSDNKYSTLNYVNSTFLNPENNANILGLINFIGNAPEIQGSVITTKTYVDNQVGQLTTNINNMDAILTTSINDEIINSKSYTDNQISIVNTTITANNNLLTTNLNNEIINSKSYTDSEITTLNSSISANINTLTTTHNNDIQILNNEIGTITTNLNAEIANAKTYTDNEIIITKTYTDTKTSSNKSYMDTTFMMLNSINTLLKSNSTISDFKFTDSVIELENANYSQLIHSGTTFYMNNNEKNGVINFTTKDSQNNIYMMIYDNYGNLKIPNIVYGLLGGCFYYNGTSYNLQVNPGAILMSKPAIITDNDLRLTNSQSNTFSQIFQDSSKSLILSNNNINGSVSISSNNKDQFKIIESGVIFKINNSVYTSTEGQSGFRITNSSSSENLYFGINSGDNTYSYIQSSKTAVGTEVLLIQPRGGNLHLGGYDSTLSLENSPQNKINLYTDTTIKSNLEVIGNTTLKTLTTTGTTTINDMTINGTTTITGKLNSDIINNNIINSSLIVPETIITHSIEDSYTSLQYGINWKNTNISMDCRISAMSKNSQYIILAEHNGNIKLSRNYGSTFTDSSLGTKNWSHCAMSSTGKYQILMMASGDFYVSSDYGSTFNIPQYTPNSYAWVGGTISKDGKYMYVIAQSSYVFVSTDYGKTFISIPTLGKYMWKSITTNKDGKYVLITITNNNMLLSSNYGITYNEITNMGSQNWTNSAMSEDGKYMMVIVSNNSVWKSNNYGAIWTNINYGSVNYTSVAISPTGQNQIIIINGINVSQIYYSSNYGATFNDLNDLSPIGLPAQSSLYNCSINENDIIITQSSGNVYTSSNKNCYVKITNPLTTNTITSNTITSTNATISNASIQNLTSNMNVGVNYGIMKRELVCGYLLNGTYTNGYDPTPIFGSMYKLNTADTNDILIICGGYKMVFYDGAGYTGTSYTFDNTNNYYSQTFQTTPINTFASVHVFFQNTSQLHKYISFE